MKSLNKAMLIGNLGSDPELRHTASGQAVASFNLATNEVWGGKDGQPQQERTEWHRIVLWGRLAEVANEYLRKGSRMYVEGRIQTRQWQDQQGNKRYTTEIIGQNMLMLGSRGGDASQGGGERSERSERYSGPPDSPGPDAAGPDFVEDDNDLPF